MQRIGLFLLTAGLLAVAFAHAAVLAHFAEGGAPFALAVGSTATLAGIAVLGAARRGRSASPLALALAVAFLAVAMGLVAGLLLPVPTADGPLLLGLPRVTAILLLLAGALPLLLLPVAYALFFDEAVLDDGDIDRVHEAAAARPAGNADPT